MPFDPSSLAPDVALWVRAKNHSTGSASSLTDESGWGNDLTGSGGTITASSTPNGGNALVGTGLGYYSRTHDLGMHGGPLVASSDTCFDITFNPGYAVDGNSSGTPWASQNSNTTGWYRVRRSGSASAATSYQITPRSGNLTQAPKTWTFEGSMDGSTGWTTLDTQTNYTSWSPGVTASFSFSNSTAYVYYRLNVTANNGDTGNWGFDEFKLDNVTNTASPKDGEYWIVLKTNGGSGPQSWKYGTNGSASHYTYGGAVYDDTGSTTRWSFTPSVDVTQWRLYRIKVDGTNWTAYLDGASEYTTSGSTKSWSYGPKIFDTFSGAVAEFLLVGRTLTSGEVADLITYFNTEHGLSVPGGSTPPSEAALPNPAAIVAAPVPVAGISNSAPIFGEAIPDTPFAGINNPAAIGATPVPAAGIANPANVVASPILVAGVNNPGAFVAMLPPTPFAFDFAAKGDLTATIGTITVGFLTIDLKAKADLTIGSPITATFLALDMQAKASLNVVMARPSTVDPVTGLPQYRLVAVQADGTRLAELPRAVIGDITEEIGLDGTRLDFTLSKYDATNAFVMPAEGEQVREVQVWRGPNLETWQRVDGARLGESTIDYDCSGLGGYLGDRMIGKFPKTDLLVNGRFEDGTYGWSFTNEPSSIPPVPPTHSIETVDFFGTKAKALRLGGASSVTTVKSDVETAAVFVPNSASYLPGGEAIIIAAANSIPSGTDVHIVGHTAYNYLDGDYGNGLALSLDRAQAARATLAGMGKGFTFSLPSNWSSIDSSERVDDGTVGGRGRYAPVASNDTYAGQARNRRVEFSYSTTVTAAASSAQYAKGSLTSGTITVPTSTKRAVPVTFFGWAYLDTYLAASQHGYGVYIQLARQSTPTVVFDSAYSTLDDTTPLDVWERHEATVKVPADGNVYVFDVRFYAPGGSVLWTHGGVYPEEALHFPDTDQALIAKGIVEHVQDPAMGKLGDTPILIGTQMPLTGQKRTKTYPYHERRYASDALDELAAMHGGVDLRIGFDETTRWLETHYPQLGSVVPITLALGSNVVAYDAPMDATASGTRWVAQALESSGADREEGLSEDLSRMGGMLIERLAYAEPGTAVTELEQTAQSHLKRFGGPVIPLEVTVGKVGASIAAQTELTSWFLDHVKVGDVVDVEIIDGPIEIVGPHRVVRRRLTPNTDQVRYSLSREV